MRDQQGLSENGKNVRRYDRDRFVTALFAPPAAREDLFTLYAFNVEIARIRETVSEPMLGQIRLQWWRDALDCMCRGDPAHHPVADGLSALIRRQSLPRPLFDRLLEAREFDMQDQPPETLAQLKLYVEDSSAGLSALAALVLGGEDDATQEAARHVGQAWGLIGLLRAHPFAIKLRRLYLPVKEKGLDIETVLAGEAPRGLIELSEQIAATAAGHLASARKLRREVSKNAIPALLPAKLADSYLAKLRKAGFNPTDRDWSAVNTRPLSLMVATGLGRF
ncbi:MAG TPA: phytoene/squalene synthase family protein [Magnetospirillaceae bacterium]|nr:phytoene/squalene synthase family protein [Magnetospirillaceae bacterium]